MTPRLDEWIASLADPEDLASGQEVDPGAGNAALLRQLNEANSKVAALIAAVESGVAVEDLTDALRRRTAERDELQGPPGTSRATPRHVGYTDHRIGTGVGRTGSSPPGSNRGGTGSGVRKPGPAS